MNHGVEAKIPKKFLIVIHRKLNGGCTTHIATQGMKNYGSALRPLRSIMCVCLTNCYIDSCYGHGYIRAIEAVFVLTVLCQQICVEGIYALFLNFPSKF